MAPFYVGMDHISTEAEQICEANMQSIAEWEKA